MAASTSNEASTAAVEDATVRPFHIEVPQEDLDDLRRRIAATRWPEKEPVADQSQGVQLATIQALARYWGTNYDLRRFVARLNALPQFITGIDGLDIHFIHVKSPHEQALPLIITHGWPGSVIELLEVIDPSPTRPPTADAPRTPSISCCRRCPATASRTSRSRSAGTPGASRRRGRS
jgi:Epoxide hydrolase N terminus